MASSDDPENSGSAVEEGCEGQNQSPTCLTLFMVRILALFLVIPHMIIGPLSILIGLTLVSKAPVVLANTIAPFWSGIIFVTTGLFGLFAAKSKTPYMMCCFGGFSIISLMAGVISMQLLRMGLVDLTTDGEVFMKENLDALTLIGIALAGAECIASVISGLGGFLLANSLRNFPGTEVVVEPTKEQLMAERQEELRRQKQQEKRLRQKARLARTYQKV